MGLRFYRVAYPGWRVGSSRAGWSITMCRWALSWFRPRVRPNSWFRPRVGKRDENGDVYP